MAALRDTPLAAFAELRFRLTWRRLLGRRGIGELVAKVIGYLLLLPIGLVVSIGIGAGMYRAAPPAATLARSWTCRWTCRSRRCSSGSGRPGPRPRWPCRTRSRSTCAATWSTRCGRARSGSTGRWPGCWATRWRSSGACCWAGRSSARRWAGSAPGSCCWRSLLVLFAAATLAWLALIQELGARVLRRARLKSLLFAGVYVALAVAVVAAGRARSPPAGPARLARGAEVAAVDRLARARWRPAAARRLFRGDVARVAAVARGAGGCHGGDRLGGLPAGARRGARGRGRRHGAGGRGARRGGRAALAGAARGALLEREVTFLTRHPLPLVLGIILPAVAGLIAWKARPYLPAEAGEVVRALPVLGVALYVHLATQTFWLNGFGWERGGARLYFLAPVPPGAGAAGQEPGGRRAGARHRAGLGAGDGAGRRPAAGLGAGRHAWRSTSAPRPGSSCSATPVAIWNPRVAPLTLQRSGSLPALSALAGMVIFSGVTGLFALPVLLALKAGRGVAAAAGLARARCAGRPALVADAAGRGAAAPGAAGGAAGGGDRGRGLRERAGGGPPRFSEVHLPAGGPTPLASRLPSHAWSTTACAPVSPLPPCWS